MMLFSVFRYSRRIMWLEVTSTNKDPAIVAQYYVDCIRQMEGLQRKTMNTRT